MKHKIQEALENLYLDEDITCQFVALSNMEQLPGPLNKMSVTELCAIALNPLITKKQYEWIVAYAIKNNEERLSFYYSINKRASKGLVFSTMLKYPMLLDIIKDRNNKEQEDEKK